MNRRTALFGAGLAALPWVRPLSAAASTSDRTPIRLGQSAPISGPLAGVGVAFRDTALALFKEVNAQGGIGGRDIQLVTLDDEDRAERTAVNVKLLASEHHVVGLFGFVGAGAHRAGARGASEEGLPYIAPVSGSQELRSGALPWVYNLRAGHVDEIEYIARHTRNVGIERVSLVSEYNSQGWELRDALMDAFERSGTRVASITSVDHEGSRYSLPGAVGTGANEAEQPHDAVLGCEQLHVHRRALGVVFVVEREEIDLAPSDAALRIDLTEHRQRGVAERDADLRQRPADRRRLAEADRRSIVDGGPRQQRPGPQRERGQAGTEQCSTSLHHGF